jgi:hypothetical protein
MHPGDLERTAAAGRCSSLRAGRHRQTFGIQEQDTCQGNTYAEAYKYDQQLKPLCGTAFGTLLALQALDPA